MKIRLQLIFTANIVHFGLTSVLWHNQMADQIDTKKGPMNDETEIRESIKNLFNSMARNDIKKSKTYHEILEQEARKERFTFDTMKEELHVVRNRKAQQRNLDEKIDVGVKNILTVKRETKKNNRGKTGKKRRNKVQKSESNEAKPTKMSESNEAKPTKMSESNEAELSKMIVSNEAELTKMIESDEAKPTKMSESNEAEPTIMSGSSKAKQTKKSEIMCPYGGGGEFDAFNENEKLDGNTDENKKSEFADWEFYYDKDSPVANGTAANASTLGGLTFLDMGTPPVTPPYDTEDMTAKNDASGEDDPEWMQSEWRQNWTRKNSDERFEEALQHAKRPLLVNWYRHGLEQWKDLEVMKKHAARNECNHESLSEPIELVELRLNKALKTIAKYIAKFDYDEATGEKTMW